jgi:hypothetical protein
MKKIYYPNLPRSDRLESFKGWKYIESFAEGYVEGTRVAFSYFYGHQDEVEALNPTDSPEEPAAREKYEGYWLGFDQGLRVTMAHLDKYYQIMPVLRKAYERAQRKSGGAVSRSSRKTQKVAGHAAPSKNGQSPPTKTNSRGALSKFSKNPEPKGNRAVPV